MVQVQFRVQFQHVQQCIQISTRINSSSVHTYIFVCSTLRVILQGFVDPKCNMLHFGSTNPVIRMYILMLDTRNGLEFLMKQTKMYVCTLKNIYSSRCSHIAVQVGTELRLQFKFRVQFNFVQQCIQISTRINILQCTYVHPSFVLHCVQY